MNDAFWFDLFDRETIRVAAREEAALAAAPDTAATFSPAFESSMDALCRRMAGGRYRRVYGKARALLIAAIVAAVVMSTAVGAYFYRAELRYDRQLDEHVYHVEGARGGRLPADPKPVFIPARFDTVVAETRTASGYQLVLRSADGADLAVTVRPADSDHIVEADSGENDWIELDGDRFFRRRTVSETAPRTYAVILALSDDRYTVTAGVWQTGGYADEAELARIIRSVPLD